MSFTGVYTELMALDIEEGARMDRHPKVLDWDGLVEWPEKRTDISTTSFRDMLVVDEWTDRDAYPEETWKVLQGFKSWDPADTFLLDHEPDRDALVEEIRRHRSRSDAPLGYSYNMERIGIPYSGEDGFWKSFFEAVSEHTEPFAVYHSPIEHRFPDVTDFQGGEESVYYIEAVDGELYVEEQTFRRTGVEATVNDRAPLVGAEVTDGE